jgi:hypothetical protein
MKMPNATMKRGVWSHLAVGWAMMLGSPANPDHCAWHTIQCMPSDGRCRKVLHPRTLR